MILQVAPNFLHFLAALPPLVVWLEFWIAKIQWKLVGRVFFSCPKRDISYQPIEYTDGSEIRLTSYGKHTVIYLRWWTPNLRWLNKTKMVAGSQ